MSLRIHADQSRIAIDVVHCFLVAAGYDPVYSVIKRGGRIYEMWADKRTHRKILSCARLENMTLVDLVEWLHTKSRYARILFPDPLVYQGYVKEWKG